MTYLAGKIALDITAGAPNNGRGQDNVNVVKQLNVGRDIHPYVAAQAFRRWIRDSLPKGERRSPVILRGSGRGQQANTSGRPDLYLDDDLFGYMVAISGGNFQRDTVFATGSLVSVAARKPTREWGTMTRGFPSGANPVTYEHELYSAELAGDILLDLPRVGTFEQEGGGLRRALNSAAAAEALAAGAEEVIFRDVASIRLPLAERKRRVAVLLRTLAEIRGGAQRALHYGDRSPAFVLLAPVKGGNNPFTRVLAVKESRVRFDEDTFAAELEAWADELDGPVRIGWAPGFLGDQRGQATSRFQDEISQGRVIIDHPRTMLRALAADVENGQTEPWFQDPER
jgi:CRISPR-associated protein Cst2